MLTLSEWIKLQQEHSETA